MSIARRILDAVTPGRVAAALLIGAFAREILAVLGWSAGVGRDLARDENVRGLAGAGCRFALQVALIYLALRGLGAVLERPRVRGGERAGAATPAGHGSGDGKESDVDEPAERSREGGRDGSGDEE